MGRFTDNCRKEQFFIACGQKGWIYDEEKAFLDLIYDLAKVNNDPRLDGILENMVRSDMTVPEVRKAMIDEIKKGISTVSPDEKMIAAVAAIKPEIDLQKLKQDRRVWRHDVLSALEDDMKEASKRAYKERFKEMDVRDFRGKCYFKGWGAEYDETSFLRNLNYAAQSLGDKRLFDLMDEILNTDISDPEKRSTFINDIKNRVSSMSFAYENDDLVSMKKDMQKLDPVLNEERIKNIRDEQERETRRLKEEENKKRRTKLGEERDPVFIDTALKMGWKKEDIPILEAVMNLQKTVRKVSSGEPVEEFRQKVMETKLDPAKYISGRNDLLRAFIAATKDKRVEKIYRREFRTVTEKVSNILEATKDAELIESHDEQKAEWLSKLNYEIWNEPGDKEFLALLFDARIGGDGTIPKKYCVQLDKCMGLKDINDKRSWLKSIEKELIKVNTNDAWTAVREKACDHLHERNIVKSILGGGRFEEKDHVPEDTANVHEVNTAKVRILEKYINDNDLNGKQFEDVLKEAGIPDHIFARAIAEKMYAYAGEAVLMAYENDKDLQHISVLKNRLGYDMDQYHYATLSEEEKKLKDKAYAMIDGWIAEGLKAYQISGNERSDTYARERTAYTQRMRERGWNDETAEDEELLNKFFSARYDKNGQVIPNIDNLINNIPLEGNNIFVVRRNRLTTIRDALRAIPEENKTYQQKKAISAANSALVVLFDLEQRQRDVGTMSEKGWAVDNALMTMIYDVRKTLGGDIVNSITRGKCEKYKPARVSVQSPVINLQTEDMLDRVRDRLLKNTGKNRKEDAKISKALNAIDRWKQDHAAALENEKPRLAEIEAAEKSRYERSVASYKSRLANLSDEVLDNLGQGVETVRAAYYDINSLKTAIKDFLNKNKDSIKKQNADPGAGNADSIAEELYKLEQAYEEFQYQIRDNEKWPYELMVFAKYIFPERWEPYRERAEVFENTDTRLAPQKAALLAIKSADMTKISEWAKLPEGQENAAYSQELEEARKAARDFASNPEILEPLNKLYISEAAAPAKQLYLNLSDKLSAYSKSVHPDQLDNGMKQIIENYFPAVQAEIVQRKAAEENYKSGKQAFINSCREKGWVAEDEALLSAVYDAGIDKCGFAAKVPGRSFEEMLKDVFGQPKPADPERLSDLFKNISDNIHYTFVEQRSEKQNAAVSLLDTLVQQMAPEVAKIQQKRMEDRIMLGKKESWARDYLKLENPIQRYEREQSEKAARIKEESEKQQKEYRRRNHFNRAEVTGELLEARGWDRDECEFFKKLFLATVDKDYKDISTGGSTLANDLAVSLTENKENLWNITNLLKECRDKINASAGGEYTDEQKEVMPLLDNMIAKYEAIDKREQEEKKPEIDTIQDYAVKNRPAINGLYIPEAVLADIYELSERSKDNEPLMKVLGEFENVDISNKFMDRSEALKLSNSWLKQIRNAADAYGNKELALTQKVLDGISAVLNDPERKSTMNAVTYLEERKVFMEAAKSGFRNEKGRMDLASVIFDARYDRNGEKDPVFSDIAEKYLTVDNEEKLKTFMTEAGEHLKKIPEAELTAAQRSLLIKIKRANYIAPPEEPDAVIPKAPEIEAVPDIPERTAILRHLQWTLPGDREFLENLLDAGKDRDGNELPGYADALKKLSETERAKFWEIKPELQKISDALNALPEEKLTDEQKALKPQLKERIEQADLLETQWQEHVRGPVIESPLYDEKDVYKLNADGSIKMLPGQEKPHVWQDAKVAKASQYYDMLSQVIAPAKYISAEKEAEALNLLGNLLTNSRQLNSINEGKKYQEYNGEEFKNEHYKSNFYVNEDRVPDVEQKLQTTAGLFREAANKVDDPLEKEFFNGYAYCCETDHGNYTRAMLDSPYLSRLFSMRIMGPRPAIGYDNALKGLKGQLPEQMELPKEQRPKDISADYMAIMNQGPKELALEYERQKLERDGWSDPEAERSYLEKLQKTHKEALYAFDRLFEVEDRGQYDAYLDNPLSNVTNKEKAVQGERGYLNVYGIMDGESRAIDLGWNARDLGVLGSFGVVGGLIRKVHSQAESDPQRREAMLESIRELEEDYKKLAGKINFTDIAGRPSVKKEICEQVAAFREKYKDHREVASAIKGTKVYFDNARDAVEAEYRKSLGDDEYRRLEKEDYDKAVTAYEAVVKLADDADGFIKRINGLEKPGHVNSQDYINMRKAIGVLSETSKSGSVEQYMEALKKINVTAKKYQDKLKFNEGLIGNGRDRLNLAKDLQKYVKEELEALKEATAGISPYIPVGELVMKKAANAPAHKGGKNIITGTHAEQGVDGFTLKTNVFELIDKDDKEVREARFNAIDQKKAEKQRYEKGVEDAKRNARGGRRINANELQGGNAQHNNRPAAGNRQAGHQPAGPVQGGPGRN